MLPSVGCAWLQILWDHDTVFHGEDMYMGLMLHRMRKNYTIMVSAGAVVPTFAPENMTILFRQRVTSWDVCAQVRTGVVLSVWMHCVACQMEVSLRLSVALPSCFDAVCLP